jgi:type I restriction enzyme, S subunit
MPLPRPLVGEWRNWRLGDLVDEAGGKIKTGPFGSQLHAHEYVDDPDGVPVVMPRDMSNGRVDRSSVKRIDEKTAGRLSAHRLSEGDLVLARRGDIGRLASIAADEEGWVCGTGSMRIHAPDHDVLDPGFLGYAMSAPSVGEWLEGQAVGATMSNLNAEIVSAVPLRVPVIETQRRIAAACSAFDRLIAINERRIELLEDLARSLYREWFVHFRFPGHRTSRFVDSELGRIPDGWTPTVAGRIFDFNPRVDGRAGSYPKVTLVDVSTRFSHVLPSASATRPSGARYRRGDVLMARITPSLENGKTALVLFLGPDEVGIGSTELIVLRGRDVGSAFTYCAARSRPFRDHAIKSMSGASGRQRVASDCFDSLSMVRPTAEVAALFESIAMPMLEEVLQHRRQSDRLAETRDLLLPRLITGQLDVSDIDLGALVSPDPE